jgi:hypothetical protein
MTRRQLLWLILGGSGGVIIIGLVLIISKRGTFIDYLCNWKETIATLDAHSQRRIVFKADVCFENDSRPIYYEVWGPGRVVTPTTYLENDNGSTPHTFATFFAEGGSLVAVVETTVGSSGEIVIIEDFASSESWPRLRDNEVARDSIVKQKWQGIFDRLHRENPQLVKPHSLDP